MTERKDYWALSLLVLMIVWFGGEMVWGGKIPFFRDLGPYFYSMRFSLAESFKAGELPLWERHAAMGFPLLADFQSGTFYVPHLLFLVLPFFSALSVLFLLHYLLAATGAYTLCRHWGYPPSIAVVGGLLFTLGGTTVSLTNLLNHFQSAVWLPWVILFGERCVRSQSWNSFLALTAILLLQFLAGSPEIYAMSTAVLFVDGLRLKANDPVITVRKLLFLFTAANVLVLALAMVQILPTLELIGESRARRSEAIAWSLRPLQLINLFFPDKQIDLTVATPLRPFFGPNIPLLISHYLGAVAPLGVSCWFFHVSRRQKVTLCILIVISLLFAAGDYTPLYSIFLRYMPLFRLFRFPEKFFFIIYALLLYVVLEGISCLLNSNRSSRLPFVLTVSNFLAFSLLYLWLRLDSSPLTHFIVWARGNSLTTSTLTASALVLSRLEVQMGLIFGLLILIVAKKYGLLRDSLFSVLLVVFVLVDLGSVHRPLQYLVNPDVVTKNDGILHAPDPEPSRLFYTPVGSHLHPSEFLLSREVSFSQFNSLVFENLLPDTGIFYGFDYMQEIDALGRWPYTTFLSFADKLQPEPLYRLLGALNVKYIVSFFPREQKGLMLMRHFPQYPSWLYQIERVVPRAYVVNRATEEKYPVKVLERLSSDDFRPMSEVILDQQLNVQASENFSGEARIEQYENQRVTIKASVSTAGILVLADSYYPGWRAYVDGKEERILRANFFFRGVSLQPGRHRVEFRYEPVSFKIGLFISLGTLFGVVILCFLAHTRRRRQGVSTT